MVDYENIAKINWQDDKGTLARIKAQISLQEPLIIHLPVDFNLKIDAASCGCENEASIYRDCQAEELFNALADANDLAVFREIGQLAHNRGQRVDLDLTLQDLIIYD